MLEAILQNVHRFPSLFESYISEKFEHYGDQNRKFNLIRLKLFSSPLYSRFCHVSWSSNSKNSIWQGPPFLYNWLHDLFAGAGKQIWLGLDLYYYVINVFDFPLQYFISNNIYIFQRTNWENYYIEILMVAGIVVYFLNFFSGKSKNQRVRKSSARRTL